MRKLKQYQLILAVLIMMIVACAIPKECCAQDTIKVPQSDLDEIISTIDTLMEQDSINNILIKQYEILIGDYKELVKQDSLILSFRDKEVYLYSEQVKLYEKKIKVIDKWYNRRPFGFILGVATSVVLIHTIGYTLP